jgi:colanic acid biosynthesis protein WcaH
MSLLPADQFRQLIAVAPLISIDLIIRNRTNEVLLGYRRNSPARNTWFVPGGRILKNETIAKAFERITFAELGKVFKIEEASFLGVYQHLYPGDNVFEIPGIDTHYIVLAYQLSINNTIPDFNLKSQHDDYRWMKIEELISDETVHSNTRAYFKV